MVELRKLCKAFGTFKAVDNVSFRVDRGEVLGFLGPNGAGKSTAMKVVAGFLAPTSGTALVSGYDVREDPIAVKRALGYLPEGAPAYPDMTPEGFLKFVCEVRNIRGALRRERIRGVVDQLELRGVMRQPIETLSKGYKRRVGLAQALLHDPDVLILDEPTDGLDPNQKHEVRNLVRSLGSDKVIILSTHILEEVEAVCSRAVIISRGRIVADKTPAELQQMSRYHNAVHLRLRGDRDGIGDQLATIDGVAGVEPAGDGAAKREWRIFPRNGRPIITDVSEFVRSKGLEIEELHVEEGRLDDVFRDLTLHDGGTPPAPAPEPKPEKEAIDA